MKAQSALEYLMTYGWAILIVIIVGAALYALGVFNPGTFTGHKSTGFSAIQMEDFKFTTEGNLTLKLGNRHGRTINITGITMKAPNGNYYNAADDSGDCVNELLGPNEECDDIVTTALVQSQGAAYNIEVNLSYIDTKTNIEHTDFGRVSGSVEPE